MANPPRDLQIGTTQNDAYAIINENFRNAVATVADLGAGTTNTLVIPVVVAASSVNQFVVSVVSKGVTSSAANQITTASPVQALSGIAPQVDIFVDTDDANHYFPNGSSLTNAQLSMFPIVTVMNTGYAGSVGSILLEINNRDSAQHTYYVHIKAGYFPLYTSQYR